MHLRLAFFSLTNGIQLSGRRTLLIEQAYELVRMHKNVIMPCTQAHEEETFFQPKQQLTSDDYSTIRSESSLLLNYFEF